MSKAKNESLDNGNQIEFIFLFFYSREFNKLDSMKEKGSFGPELILH